MQRLERIRIAGFRSIRDMGEGLELGPVNVVIGANGAGKSNLVAFFSMLNFITSKSLALWVSQHGGATDQLYYGHQTRPLLEAELAYSGGRGVNRYGLRLFHGAPDRFVFADEQMSWRAAGRSDPLQMSLGSGHTESRVPERADMHGASAEKRTAEAVRALLDRTQVFHFHDTSANARVRQSWSLADARYLKHDGGNLAPFLLQLREGARETYDRVVGIVRLVVPFFGDFVLEPTVAGGDSLILRWRERGSDREFGPHQLSDGTLRFMLLATLLLQPAHTRPPVIIVDEPELGLHPAAVEALASMVYEVASGGGAQVILTTQSASLLDAFRAEDVVVASRVPEGTTGRYESKFARLEPEALSEWLADYSLSELWDKSVIGGRPQP